MPDIDTRLKAAVALLVVIGLMMFYRLQHPSTTFAADGIDPDWDAAVQHSHDAAEPTVVLYTANWCPTCQLLHRDVLPRSDVQQELLSHYSFYTVDLTNPTPQAVAHMRKFGVKYIPLMIRYDANGEETDRTNYLPPDQLIAWLKAGE